MDKTATKKSSIPWYLRFWFTYVVFLICYGLSAFLELSTFKFFNMFVPFGFGSMIMMVFVIGFIPLVILIAAMIYVDRVPIHNMLVKILFNMFVLFVLTIVSDVMYRISFGCAHQFSVDAFLDRNDPNDDPECDDPFSGGL